MGVSPTLMADLILANSETNKTRQVVRHAGLTRRHIWALTSRGRSLRETTQSSSQVIGHIDVNSIRLGTFYTDGQILTDTRQNNLSRFSMGWSQLANAVTWFDSEMVFNANSQFRDEVVVAKYVDMAKEKKARCQMEFAESVETALWAVPDKTTMEGTGASQTRPMSIMASHNDHFGSGTLGINGNFWNSTTGNFTTFQGIDNTAAISLFWRSQFMTYDQTAAFPTTGRNVIGALDELYELVNYVPPPSDAIPNGYSGDMWENPQWPRMVCITSFAGKRILQNLARSQGDRWQDAGASEISKGPGGALGMAPTFGGMEVFCSQKFSEGSYYADVTAAPTLLTTEFAAGGKGPRFLIVNLDMFRVMFHSEKYFTPKPPNNYEQQFYANTIWYDTYTQNMNTARHLGGIVCPGTSSGTGTSKTYTGTSVYTG